MPTINVKLLTGRTVEQKREFARVVTEQASSILKCPPEAVDVIFQDVEKHDWSVGGTLAADK